MAKVYPKRSMIQGCSDEYTSSETEVFTVWMKSLVINGNGCTVFNSEGGVVFRVDNYQTKSTTETLLMNLHGQVLFSIRRKTLVFLRRWEGYKWHNSKVDREGTWFKVKKKWKFFASGLVSCHAVLRCNNITSILKILGFQRKLTFKIMDCEGRVLAEVIGKETAGGVALGDDVLTLVVEPQIDQALVMALVIAYAMVNNKL
ncbi:protein LURP-one-related 3-like [Salvia miltiorrhiza]|uniref:protein LURP-one-related 3-like n=1 Tax=Salvia miltiorrhiza TaxID=226208 RepID=UPI0025AC8C03|nr:protein LURP-one-related 3-like [Salvia miltiorrhiza]